MVAGDVAEFEVGAAVDSVVAGGGVVAVSAPAGGGVEVAAAEPVSAGAVSTKVGSAGEVVVGVGGFEVPTSEAGASSRLNSSSCAHPEGGLKTKRARIRGMVLYVLI